MWTVALLCELNVGVLCVWTVALLCELNVGVLCVWNVGMCVCVGC